MQVYSIEKPIKERKYLMDDYTFLLKSKEACELRRDQILMISKQCRLRFDHRFNYDYEWNLNHLYHQEFDILNAQIKEIDNMIRYIRDRENKLNSFEKEETNKSKHIIDSEQIVDPIHPLSTEPRINYNLHSGSHYWDIVGK